MDKTNTTSFPLAMLDFFGKKPGEETSGFMAELKALTPEDKAYFRELLIAKGYKIA